MSSRHQMPNGEEQEYSSGIGTGECSAGEPQWDVPAVTWRRPSQASVGQLNNPGLITKRCRRMFLCLRALDEAHAR